MTELSSDLTSLSTCRVTTKAMPALTREASRSFGNSITKRM